MISNRDKEILRQLAKEIAEVAARPEQDEKRTLWKAHNMLKPTRPLIFCDPENGWGEIITEKDLLCEGDLARGWENHLRKELFWGTKMGDDRVIEPYFSVGYYANTDGWGKDWVIYGGENGGAYTWEPMIKDYDEDLPLLHFPQHTIDYEKTQQTLELAQEIFEPYLKVRIKNGWWWTLGMTAIAIDFRGIEQFMFDMYDEPENLHKMMRFLCDGTLGMLDSLQERGLLCANADESYVGSGGFGYTDELPAKDFTGKIRTQDMWGFCESQETVSVSPEMFAEFVFPYQLEILKRFGLNCYGCCEPLHQRWHVIKQIPNLRRVSVSPWCDIGMMAEFLQDQYVYSMKPNPSYIATASPDFDLIRKDLKAAIQQTKDCRVEIIMKDNNTIGNNPNNVMEWSRIAKELAMSL